MTPRLRAAIESAREALWSCAVTAASVSAWHIEAACDEARGAVNDFAEDWL